MLPVMVLVFWLGIGGIVGMVWGEHSGFNGIGWELILN
jgi:hypothetical protein